MDGEEIGQDSQVVDTGTETQGQEDTGTGLNPAWNDLLSSVPAGLHSQITPHLTKWDQNFQSKINEVHSQYEPYKPFVENQIQPDQIEYALGIMSAIENEPEKVLQALQAYIGDNSEQGLEDTNGNGPATDQPEWMQHPDWIKSQEMLNTMAQILVQQRESQTTAEMDSQLDQELSAAKEEFGDYDEEWVLNKVLANPQLSINDAVQAYQEYEKGILAKHRQPGPPVLGAGGSVANPGFQPEKLGDKDRRATVVQFLAQAAQQNQ